MECNGGFGTDEEEMDSSYHGRYDETEHNGSIDSKIEKFLLKRVIFLVIYISNVVIDSFTQTCSRKK